MAKKENKVVKKIYETSLKPVPKKEEKKDDGSVLKGGPTFKY